MFAGEGSLTVIEPGTHAVSHKSDPLRLLDWAPKELCFALLLWYQQGIIMKSSLYFVNFLYDHYTVYIAFPKSLLIQYDLFLATNFEVSPSINIMHNAFPF